MYRRFTPSKSTQANNHAAWCAKAEEQILRRNPELSGRIEWDTLSYMGKYLGMTPEAAAIQYVSRYA